MYVYVYMYSYIHKYTYIYIHRHEAPGPAGGTEPGDMIDVHEPQECLLFSLRLRAEGLALRVVRFEAVQLRIEGFGLLSLGMRVLVVLSVNGRTRDGSDVAAC